MPKPKSEAPGGDPIRRPEELSRLILDTLPTAAYACDPEGLITYFNKCAVQLWGREPKLRDPRDRYCGSFRLFSVDGAPLRHEECCMALALRDGRQYADHEILIEQPDGGRRFVMARATPFHDQEGRLCGAVSVLVDITDRRRVEAALRDDESRKSAIFNSALDAIFSMDARGCVVEINPAATAMLGYAPEELAGRSLAAILVPGGEDETLDEIRRYLRGLGEQSADQRLEMPAMRKDGREFPAELTVTVTRIGKRPPFFTAYLRDLSEQRKAKEARRQAEDRFTSFMRHLPAAAWIKDAEGRYAYANEHAQRIFRTPLEELRGRTDLEVFPAPTAQEFRRNDQQALQSREAVQTIEFLEHEGDGIHESVVTKFPMFGPRGDVAFIGGVAIDVTAHRQAVQALEQSESNLRALLDNARACVFAKDLAGRYIIVNRTMAALFGWPNEEHALGKTDYELHPPERAELFVSNDHKVLESGAAVEVEETVGHGQGSWTFLVLKFPLRDTENRIYAVCGIASDITERKRAEVALRESEERYRRLAELLPVALYTCTAPEGTISYFNQEAIRWWGRAPGAGDTDAGFCGSRRMLRSDGSLLPHQESPMAAALRDGKESRNEELVVEREDGTLTTIVVNVDPIREASGAIVGAVNVFHDMSALKQAEQDLREEKENLQTLLETLPIAVLIAHDPECKKITGNPAAAELLHMQPGANFSRTGPLDEQPTHFRTLRNGESIPAHDLPVQRAARGEIVSGEQFDYAFEDGKTLHSLVSARPLYDAAGQPRGAIASVLDITSLKAAEKALKDADRRKDEFLATLGHELRNPLAPIRMGLELMTMVRDNPAKLEQTRSMMERQARQLIRLVDDLLDVSRITRGKIELRRSRTKLGDIVRSAVEASIPFIEEARHDLTIDFPREEIFLNADPSRLTQVLSNLLNNASKFTPAGGKISLSARTEGGDAVVTITDNGVGIPAEMLDRIFEMFTQLKDSQETSHAGLGIGLTLVKVLVEMHGGRIEVQSRGIGRGASFIIRLPILEAVRGEGGRSSSRSTVPAGGRLRVLVVDDNEAAADTLGSVIELMGHETRLAGDGGQAIQMALEFLPDVVVMDLGMPAMNGYEAARRIRAQPWGQGMTLIALSGWGQDEHKQRAAEAGFDHHLVKPAEPAELKRLFSKVDRKRG